MSNTAKIRPSARILSTIGKELIKDAASAVVELVKNSYDADSDTVDVKLEYIEEKQRLIISVSDEGHGMSEYNVEHVWLVPATEYKKKTVESPGKRILQGKKGIGRFAATMLGDRVLLETTQDGVTTNALLDMEEINQVTYLDELNILIESENSGKKNGTSIIIERDNINYDDLQELWAESQIKKLDRELKTLVTPKVIQTNARNELLGGDTGTLDISLEIVGFEFQSAMNGKELIKPIPIYDFFDYQIVGTISEDGEIQAQFWDKVDQKHMPLNVQKKIPFHKGESSPGQLYFDIRIYERDKTGLSRIIDRGMQNQTFTDSTTSKLIRSLLNDLYGVSLYRGGFRVRPYGDQDYDWLEIDKKRTQKSKRIGHNQTIGYVLVENEHKSKLTEKSARDGLVENAAYSGLKVLLGEVISLLEEGIFSSKKNQTSEKNSLNDRIDDLFSLNTLQTDVGDSLDSIKLEPKIKQKVETVLNKAIDKEIIKKKKEAKEIKEQLALYQGDATLGRVTHVILHEGRKHVKFISETAPRLNKWINRYLATHTDDLKTKIITRSNDMKNNSDRLAYLFKKIEPLSRTRQEKIKSHKLIEILESSRSIFDSDIEKDNVAWEASSELKNIHVDASRSDLITIFSNLIENSLYWLKTKQDFEPKIIISVYETFNNSCIIEFKDNGPGFIDADVSRIFEPGYSRRRHDEGTGLGLTIAGDAASRIPKGKIQAVQAQTGASFHITFQKTR